MKRLKKIDFWLSVTLISFFTIASIVARRSFSANNLLLGYLVVGTWQSISMIMHSVRGVFVRRWSPRFIYQGMSILAIAGLFTGSTWIYLMVWVAPLMAVYYTWLCYRETFFKMRRPLDLLK